MLDPLTVRAATAYYRRRGEAAPQPAPTSGLRHHKGHDYIALVDYDGATLAVYRHYPNGELRQLLRWPPAVAPAPTKSQP